MYDPQVMCIAEVQTHSELVGTHQATKPHLYRLWAMEKVIVGGGQRGPYPSHARDMALCYPFILSLTAYLPTPPLAVSSPPSCMDGVSGGGGGGRFSSSEPFRPLIKGKPLSYQESTLP